MATLQVVKRTLLALTEDGPTEVMDTTSSISRTFGWIYFIAWSLSFYPQLIATYRRRSVTGLSVDFFTINVVGFAAYTTSTYLFLFSPTVRRQYAERHPHSPRPTVQLNDLAFGINALVMASLMWSQLWFWGFKREKTQRLTRAMLSVIVASASAISISSALSYFRIGGWELLDVVYTLSYVKLAITVLKYIPQAYLNYSRQSTKGWSIYNILLDTTGGTLSLAQLFWDSALSGDMWGAARGNPMKLGLGFVTLAFDALFMAQHYVWYRGNEPRQLVASEDGEEDRDSEMGSEVDSEEDEERGTIASTREGQRGGYGTLKASNEGRIRTLSF
ncbi:PQ loop repeat-domain-containing protein [Peziza echinospora]|nr:PQ loop repeat-domain-containing protein [Peziza echinospora]